MAPTTGCRCALGDHLLMCRLAIRPTMAHCALASTHSPNMPPAEKRSHWRRALKASRSGCFLKTKSLSSGCVAEHKRTSSMDNSSKCSSKTDSECNTTRCGMLRASASMSSATHHAREKSRKLLSIATICPNPGWRSARCAIMSSNLLTSLWTGSWLWCFGCPHSHPNRSQIVACWFTEMAQIQYVASSCLCCASSCLIMVMPSRSLNSKAICS
mmetsp:Transcript_129746/g.323350  ORF Transcript_129746/g.323350 Transcript_129746/m.323350 type:complete len:214 (-) Transcript_129746:155-796(-)